MERQKADSYQSFRWPATASKPKRIAGQSWLHPTADETKPGKLAELCDIRGGGWDDVGFRVEGSALRPQHASGSQRLILCFAHNASTQPTSTAGSCPALCMPDATDSVLALGFD